MNLQIYDDYETLSAAAATVIFQTIVNNPTAVLCLASGDSPRLAYNLLTQKLDAGNADASRITVIGLDEWLGVPPDNEGSCHHFFQKHLFSSGHFSNERIHLFDGLTADPEGAAEKMNRLIQVLGGIDLMVLGIGMNGHIGFNEPGTSFDSYAHVAQLDAVTTSVGQKYFREKATLDRGVTLGLRHVAESRKVIVMASGTTKAEIVHKSLQARATEDVPASILQQLPQAHVMIDKAAAALLTQLL